MWEMGAWVVGFVLGCAYLRSFVAPRRVAGYLLTTILAGATITFASGEWRGNLILVLEDAAQVGLGMVLGTLARVLVNWLPPRLRTRPRAEFVLIFDEIRLPNSSGP
jgi:hypothetical protein